MSWLLSPVGSIASINHITDVTITSIAAEDLLVWSGSAWVNGGDNFLRHVTASYDSADVKVASSAPGGPAKGDMWFDTTPLAFLENIVEDTTPQLGGNLESNSKNINMNDDKINFSGATTGWSIQANEARVMLDIAADDPYTTDYGIFFGSGGYVALGAGDATIAGGTGTAAVDGDTIRNSIDMLVENDIVNSYIAAQIGFYADSVFQFGTNVLDGDFCFYAKETSGPTYRYPFFIDVLDRGVWIQDLFDLKIGNAGSYGTRPTSFMDFNHDGTDMNFDATVTTDLNITGVTTVNVPALASSGAVTGSNLNVANWDTAHGWGDHASGGYAPLAAPNFTGTIDLAGAAVVQAPASASISNQYNVTTNAYDVDMQYRIGGTLTAIMRWDSSANLFQWMDRDPATVIQMALNLETGALAVTGAVTGSNLAIANWNTAYGWGNHASTYLPLVGGTLTGELTLSHATTARSWHIQTGATADEGKWAMFANSDTFYLRAYNDAQSATDDALVISRSAENITQIATGGHLVLSENNHFIYGKDTGAATKKLIGLDSNNILIIGESATTRGLFVPSFFMRERAAAESDIGAYGQLWIKNTTPCQLWFTDDAGTDTQIV